jgi:integrase/recombinase XerC
MSMQKRPVRTAWNVPITDYSTAQRAAGRATSTIRARSELLAQLSREVGGDPWDLTEHDLVEWMGLEVWDTDLGRLRSRWSLERRRSVRSTLQGFYRWAHGTGLVDVDPAAGLARVKVSEADPRPVPDDVYKAALAHATPREVLMLRLAAELGMRREEVARVHTDDLSDDLTGKGKSLLVHGKGGKNRTLPLSHDLAALLHRQPRGYLFPGACDGHLSPRWVGTCVARLLEGDYTMHKLRHAFATGIVARQPNIVIAQRLLGHTSLATTQRYVKPDADLMRAAVEALHHHLDEIRT